MRQVISGLAVVLVVTGLLLLAFGFILLQTGVFGLLLRVGGGYMALHGSILLLEAWFSGRQRS